MRATALGLSTPHPALLRVANPRLSLMPLGTVGLTGNGDRLGWPVDDLGVPTFDWADGDGDNFLLSGVPTLFDAVVGTPDAGVATPWTRHDGQVITATMYDVGDYRKYTPALDPTAAQAIVCAILLRCRLDGATANILGNNASGIGWRLTRITTEAIRFTSNDGATNVQSTGGAGMLLGWNLIVATHVIGGTQYLYRNGVLADSDSTAAQVAAPASGLGIALNATPAGGNNRAMTVARAAIWYGAGLQAIADATWQARLARYVLGTRDHQAEDAVAFTRAGAALLRVGTRYHLLGDSAPRVCATGAMMEPAATNKVYACGPNPQATTGWSATGGTMSVVDDSAALIADGLRELGPNVHRFIPGAADRIVYGGATTGNTNPHSISIWLRGDAGGESVDVGLRDASSGAFQLVDTITCATSWQLVVLEGITPSDTDMQLGLDCDAGDTIYHVLATLEETAHATSPIPNLATAATGTRPASVLTTQEAPSDAQGSIELCVTPEGWGGADWGAQPILVRSGAATTILGVGAGGTWTLTLDGTTTIDSTVAPVDGTEHRIRIRWCAATSTASITIGGVRATGAYDGTIQSSGTWRVQPGAPVYVRDLRTHRNGGG